MAKTKADSFFKNINNEYSFNLGIDWDDLKEDKNYYPTPYLALNFMLSGNLFGGVPKAPVILGGKRATFKSNVALVCAASVLRGNDNAFLLFYDYEGVATKENFDKAQIKQSQLLEPRKFTNIEQLTNLVLNDCVNVIQNENNKDKQFVIVIDGIGMAAAHASLEKILDGQISKQMGVKAKSLNELASSIMPIINEYSVPLIVCNHVYDEVGTMYPKAVFKGGEGFMNICDTALLMTKSNLSPDKDKATNIATGSKFKMRAAKSRNINQEFVLELEVGYDDGINPFSGLFDMGLNISNAIQKVTPQKYSLITIDGEAIEVNGKLDFKRAEVEKDANFWRIVFKETTFIKDIKDKLYLKDKALIDDKALEAWDLINEFS